MVELPGPAVVNCGVVRYLLSNEPRTWHSVKYIYTWGCYQSPSTLNGAQHVEGLPKAMPIRPPFPISTVGKPQQVPLVSVRPALDNTPGTRDALDSRFFHQASLSYALKLTI